jgi:hypothetical protein
MKTLAIFVILILVLQGILAVDLTIETIEEENVLVKGLDAPAKFSLSVQNNGESDEFRFYNLLGFQMNPVRRIPISKGETEIVEIVISPRDNLDTDGFFTLNYYVQGTDGSEVGEKFLLEIIDLDEAFVVGSEDIGIESDSVEIYIKNKKDYSFEDLDVKFSSVFFEEEVSLNLGANEVRNFTIPLVKSDFEYLTAGFYSLITKLEVQGQEAEVEGKIRFAEIDLLDTSVSNSGFFVIKKSIKKENQGNTVALTEVVVEKNILSRLFTSFNVDPDFVDRTGGKVKYSWSKEVRPSEIFEVVVTTNWLFPFVIIILLVLIVIFIKKYTEKDIAVRKRVTFVRTKTGTFALKVSLAVNAKKYVEKVNIIDRLPALVKVYHRFGGSEPTRVDEDKRRLDWNFEKLEAGENRLLTYVIYSKVGIMGKFALPSATAIYEKEGEIKETSSNKAYFVAEQEEGKELENKGE